MRIRKIVEIMENGEARKIVYDREVSNVEYHKCLSCPLFWLKGSKDECVVCGVEG